MSNFGSESGRQRFRESVIEALGFEPQPATLVASDEDVMRAFRLIHGKQLSQKQMDLIMSAINECVR